MQPYFLAEDPQAATLKSTLKSAPSSQSKGTPDQFDRYDMLFIFQMVGAVIGSIVSFWSFRNLVIQEQFIQKTKSYLQERKWIIWVAAFLIIALAVAMVIFFRMLNERNSIAAQQQQLQDATQNTNTNPNQNPVSHNPTLIT